MVILIFSLLASLKKNELKNREKYGVSNHHLWVIVANQPMIHSGIWYVNEIGDPSYAQRTESNKQAR